MARIVFESVEVSTPRLVIVPGTVSELVCLLLLALNESINVPTGEVSQVLKQDPLDALEGFFASLEFSKNQTLEGVGLCYGSV